jgi:hypothetical protein
VRLDRPLTLPELEPAFRAYSGEALRPFLEARRLSAETLAECGELAIERCDREGARLARILVRLPRRKREALRRALGAPGLDAAGSREEKA